MVETLVAGLIVSIIGVLLTVDLVSNAYLYVRFQGWMARSQPLPGHRKEMVDALYERALVQQARGERVVLSTWTDHYYLPEFSRTNRQLQVMLCLIFLIIGGLLISNYAFNWGE